LTRVENAEAAIIIVYESCVMERVLQCKLIVGEAMGNTSKDGSSITASTHHMAGLKRPTYRSACMVVSAARAVQRGLHQAFTRNC
jgi:hypothetical protein